MEEYKTPGIDCLKREEVLIKAGEAMRQMLASFNIVGLQPGNDDRPADGMAARQKHYQVAEVQPIEIMQMYLSPEEFRGFLKGNAIKYLLRCGHKDDSSKELDKAFQYVCWLRLVMAGGKVNPREGMA